MTRILAASFLCLTAAAAAQQTTFRSGVELVQIDVVVLDERGRHVTGLEASDFALTDRKQPQTIAAFEEVSHRREAASTFAATIPAGVRLDIGTNHTVQADRLIVMVVDDLHLWTGRTDKAKELARAVLSRLGAEATMSVLFTSGERSVEPTQDRAVLFGAIDTLRGRQSVRRPNAANDRPGAPVSVPDDTTPSQTVRADTLQQFFDNMTKYKVLEDAARMLGAGDVRRKAFVLISEGIGHDIMGVFDSEIGPCEQRSPLSPCYHERAARSMMESLRRSNVVTYGLDPRGYISSQDVARESFGDPGGADDPVFRWNNPVRQSQDGLSILAEASGGFAVVNTNDFAGGISRIVADLDHYYLLGFQPSNPKGRTYRPIDVTVPAHPTWRVRFRKGYRPGAPPEPPKNRNPLVALSARTLPATGIAMRLAAVPLPSTAKESPIALTIEVSAPRDRLREPDGRYRDELAYEVVVVDEQKKRARTMGGLKARVTLSPRAGERELPDVATYQVAREIALAPGRYQLRVSAQSAKMRAGGSVYLNIDVPDPKKEPLTISGFALGYASGPRVAAPAQVSRLPFAPTLDRTFAPSDTLRVYFEMAPSGATPGMLTVEDARGDVRGQLAFTADARGRVDVRVPLASLAPGGYALRAKATSGGATAVRETAFVIADRR